MKSHILLFVLFISSLFATHDPNLTVTIFVHGFDPDGAEMEGVFGDDLWDESMNLFADFVGLPNIIEPGSEFIPNVVTSTTYYGDTPPDYYSQSDINDVNQITAIWGGGVPRYAMIVAKYAKFVIERSGAEQVNFFSGSFGSYVTRWLIEKDIENLASDGKIARWQSAEGVVCGNWAASNEDLTSLWDDFGTPPIDVDHMHYDWCNTNMHNPRIEADNPLFGNILIGFLGTTEDSPNDHMLTDAMLLAGEPQANDGVVALADSYFHTVTSQSQYLNQLPTISQFHRNHYDLAESEAVMTQVANFLTGRIRVSVTITRVQVNDINEPNDPWWDFAPAEIVFQTRANSPLLISDGIDEPLSLIHREGINAPVRYFDEDGETQYFEQIIYDDFLDVDETTIEIELWADEIDWDEYYDIIEEIGYNDPIDEMDGGNISVSVTGNGTYYFETNDWNCDITVEVVEYPFNLLEEDGEQTTLQIPFSDGWNWFSINIENEDMSLNSVLSSIGDNASMIKNQTGFAQYYDGYGWYGLDEIDVTSMYMISLSQSTNFELSGEPINYAISLEDGWNWIAYFPQTSIDVSSALDCIQPNGEFLKNQDSFAQYYDGFGWYSGNGLDTMNPGDGYMLQMNSEDQLIY